MGDLVRLEAVVRGRVQGVGFRYYVSREARRLGLAGWVANERDGSVRAVVERVSTVRMPGTGGFDGFVVRSAAHGGD